MVQTENGIKWGAREVACANEVLSRGQSEMDEIIILTDEEVVVLDGVNNEQLVVTPWLDENSTDEDSSVFVGVALRGLLARGMVLPTQVEEGSDQAALVADAEITGPLMLRRSSQCLLAAEQTVSTGKLWRYFYCHNFEGAVVVMEEEVGESGLHNFRVYPKSNLAARVMEFIDPDGVVGNVDGVASSIAVDKFETDPKGAASLADARRATVFTAVAYGAEGPKTVTVYTRPESLTALEADLLDGEPMMQFKDVSADSMAELIDWLSETPHPGENSES